MLITPYVPTSSDPIVALRDANAAAQCYDLNRSADLTLALRDVLGGEATRERIIRYFVGLDWTPADVRAEMEAALALPADPATIFADHPRYEALRALTESLIPDATRDSSGVICGDWNDHNGVNRAIAALILSIV